MTPPLAIEGEFWLAWERQVQPRWAHNVWVGTDGQVWGGVEWWVLWLAALAGNLPDVEEPRQLRLIA